MAYLEIHQSVRDHRKVLALAAELELPEAHVVGLAVMLWLWAIDNAPEGVLPGSERLIERAAGWTGPSGALVAGMVAAGFLDRDDEGRLHIHDWMEYAGRLIQQRKDNAERQRHWRQRQQVAPTSPSRNAHVGVTLPARHGATVENSTVPYTTVAEGSPATYGEGDRQGISAVAAAGGSGANLSPPQAPDASLSAPASQAPPKLKTIYGEDAEPMQLARALRDGILSHKPDARLPRDLQKWAREFDLMLRVDHRPRDAVTTVIAYTVRSSFWRKVVFSAEKLREKFDVIESQMREDSSHVGRNGARGRSAGPGSRPRVAASSAAVRRGEAVASVKW